MSSDPSSSRLTWLDQYRGYTVLGMFVVNFVGSYKAVPAWLKHHHTYFSYADSIMPQFLFAVGFAFRLTFLRRVQREGWNAAAAHAARRNFALLLVGLLLYGLGHGFRTWEELTGPGLWPALLTGLKRDLFQTLVHIAVTSLWVLPVIGSGGWPRVLFALGSGLAHLVISYFGYYQWVTTPPNGIDGGPLGFLTWTIPLIVGTLACDALAGPRQSLGRLTAAALALMLIGYGLSCLNRVTPPNGPAESVAGFLVEAPFVPPSQPVNLWTMSQRAGSLTYLTFASGFALAVAILFVILCGRLGWRSAALDTFGRNALAGYLVHEWVSTALKPWVPRDAPLWYVTLAAGVFVVICYALLRWLEKQGLFLRL